MHRKVSVPKQINHNVKYFSKILKAYEYYRKTAKKNHLRKLDFE